MTLFKITCDTCRTSLNVRQKSAIGQILACPKCGSMVQVKPPENWEGEEEPVSPRQTKKPFVKPVPDPNLPETVSTVSSSVADGLENTVVKGDRNNEDRWQGNQDGELPNVETEKSGPTIAPPRQPDLPGDQWDTSKARQRKKLLVAFSSAGAVLVFGIVAIVFAVMQFTGGNGKNKETDGTNLTKVDIKKNDQGSNPAKEKGKPSKDKESNSNDKKPDDGKDKKAPVKKGDAKEGPSKEKQPNKSDSPKTPDPNKDKKEEPAKSKTKSDDAPPDFPGSSDDDVDEGALPDFFREIDKFSVIFEQDEPLLKLREAFTEKDLPGIYGLSRYFVSKSLKKTPDPNQSLQVPIAAVSFKQTTLLEFLQFHYQLTSVPVSVDLTTILLSGIRLDQKFDFSATNKTTKELLKTLAKQLGLDLLEGTNSLVLTIKDREKLIEVTYPVDDITTDADSRKLLIQEIEKFINRKSWSTVGGVGIVTSNDDSKSIVVKHYGWAQVRVAEFLRHIRMRKGLPLKNENPNFPKNLHRLELAESAYATKISLLYADPISLSELFARISRDHDLHVFINWESTGQTLLPSGNLPLAVESEEFGKFIYEFAAGVKLQLVWHSPNVVELTSDLGASSNLTFESYDIQKAVSKTFPPDKLMKALTHLLESNDLANFERAELGVDLQDQESIYAVLPQSAHLNVLKILKSAEAVSAAKK